MKKKNMPELPVLRSAYRILPGEGDKRSSLVIPHELFEDLQKMAEYNGRDWKEELLARVRATLLDNEGLMATDRLMVLIYNKKLAVKNPKYPRGGKRGAGDVSARM